MSGNRPVSANLKTRAETAMKEGRLHEAELLYRQLIANLEYLFGHDHLEIAAGAHALAEILERQGKSVEAIAWRERTSDILLKLDGRK